MLISPYCTDDPCSPFVAKVGEGGDMDYVMKCAKIGVDRLRGAGSAGSRNLTFSL